MLVGDIFDTAPRGWVSPVDYVQGLLKFGTHEGSESKAYAPNYFRGGGGGWVYIHEDLSRK